jgi:hypothetical protein
VIPKPGSQTNLLAEAKKVVDPFSAGLWAMIFCIFFLSAALSLWFSDRKELAAEYRVWQDIETRGNK